MSVKECYSVIVKVLTDAFLVTPIYVTSPRFASLPFIIFSLLSRRISNTLVNRLGTASLCFCDAQECCASFQLSFL